MMAGVHIPNGDAEALKPSAHRKPFGPRIVIPNTTPDQDARFTAILSNARWNGAELHECDPKDLPHIDYAFPQFAPDPNGKVAQRKDKADALNKRDALMVKVSAANNHYLMQRTAYREAIESRRAVRWDKRIEKSKHASKRNFWLGQKANYLQFMVKVDKEYDELYRVAPSVSNKKKQASPNFCPDFYRLDPAVIRYTLESMIALCAENGWFREPTVALFSNLEANHHLVDNHKIRHLLKLEFDQTDGPIGSGATSAKEFLRQDLIRRWVAKLRATGLSGCRGESSAASSYYASDVIVRIWEEEKLNSSFGKKPTAKLTAKAISDIYHGNK